MSDVKGRRYNAVSIALHWTIAALILSNIAIAWRFEDLLQSAVAVEKQAGFRLIQLHKSIGLTVLTLTALRLLWRLWHPLLPLPSHMPGWQRTLARGTHYGFYVLMLGIPLLGWALTSASLLQFPISYFGLFEWPKLPLTPDKATAESLSAAHGTAALVLLALVALHIAGALKHQLIDKDGLIGRMVPGLGRA